MPELIRYGGCVTGAAEERAIIKSIKKSRQTRNWQAADEAKAFEGELSKYLGVKHTVLTTSGSAAGLLALSALELPPGSEVIIPATTFPTIFNMILQCGLKPVVVDCKVGTYNLDANEVTKVLNENIKAVIAVSALGNPPDLSELAQVCKDRNIPLLLDNCDGLGTTIHGRSVEQYADIAFTSFHAAHIVSMGVGGGVFTNNHALARNVRMYRDWGRQADSTAKNTYPQLPADYNPRFIYEKIGYNLQILELQAAMGRVQLKGITKVKKLRQKNFAKIAKLLEPYKEKGLILPTPNPDADVCWFAFPLTYIADRAKLVKHLEKHDIETRSMFAGNITKHPAYNEGHYRLGNELTEADYILAHSFWITCHNSLTTDELKRIGVAFKTFFAHA